LLWCLRSCAGCRGRPRRRGPPVTTEALTPRLVVSELLPSDARELFEVRGDAEAMAFWDWPADPRPEVTAAVVEEMLRESRSGRAKYWTLRFRADRAFVGLCDLSELRPGDSADIGFMLVRRRWGQGLAQEAVSWLLGHAHDIGLTSVHARVAADNERSIRLMERAGFAPAQVIPDFEIRPGVFRCCRTFRRVP
jgi:ribosomal-protein-alanine N-acetyltransferase